MLKVSKIQSSGKYKSKPQRDTTSHPVGWLESKRQMITSVREAVVKSEPSSTAGGNIRWYSQFGK